MTADNACNRVLQYSTSLSSGTLNDPTDYGGYNFCSKFSCRQSLLVDVLAHVRINDPLLLSAILQEFQSSDATHHQYGRHGIDACRLGKHRRVGHVEALGTNHF